MSHKIVVFGPQNKPRVFKSAQAVSRVLTGDGSNRLRHKISKAVKQGGDYIGDVWVQSC